MFNFVWKQRQHTALAILTLTAVAYSLAFATTEIKWEKSIEKGMMEAQKTGKPIMMDFYTEWWGSCKRLDATTFSDSRVIELSEKFVSLKVNPESSDEHAKAYRTYGDGTGAVPAIAFVDTEGDSISVIVGYRDAKQFSVLMEETLKEEERFQELKTKLREKPNDPKINAEIAIIYAKRGNFKKGKPLTD